MSKKTVKILNKEIKSLADKHFVFEKQIAAAEKNLLFDNLEIEKRKVESKR